MADIRVAIGGYPPAKELARIDTPVMCGYGSRSSDTMVRITRSLARAIPTATIRPIEGAGHAVVFDAPAALVQMIVETVRI